MAKPFPEVFPDLHMEENLQELLGLVEVERVASNRDRSSVRIYIKSPRLIQKKDIYSLEKAIRDQLFPGRKLAVKIVERYRLSSQYTPEKLMDVYRDSVLLELKNYSIIEYSMFRRAECAFPEPDLLHLTVEDTMVNREKAPELKRVLEKIFHERCGLPVRCSFPMWSLRPAGSAGRSSCSSPGRWRRSPCAPPWGAGRWQPARRRRGTRSSGAGPWPWPRTETSSRREKIRRS